MNEQMMIIVVIVIVLGIVLAFFLYKKEKYTDTDLPPGNYIRSCMDMQMSGNTLSADCWDEYGRINKTSYDTTKPCNNIQNINGTLKCTLPRHSFIGIPREINL